MGAGLKQGALFKTQHQALLWPTLEGFPLTANDNAPLLSFLLQNFPPMDSNGKADPYIIMEIHPRRNVHPVSLCLLIKGEPGTFFFYQEPDIWHSNMSPFTGQECCLQKELGTGIQLHAEA